jgi:outer membrane protein TolC
MNYYSLNAVRALCAAVLTVCCSLAAPATVAAHAALPLPPEEAVLAAIDERPAVQAALAGQQAAEARARGLRAGTHEFLLGGNWHERRVDGEGGYDEWEASVSRGVRWPGKARIDRSLADLEGEVAHSALADARHEEARTLLVAWFGWLRAAAEAKHEAALAEALVRTAAALQRQTDHGEAAPMMRELAAAEAGKAQARAVRSRLAERQARHALAIAFPKLPLPEQAPAVGEPSAPTRAVAEWRETIFRENHELQLAQLAHETAELAARRAQADRLPDPTVGVRVLSERTGAERAVGLMVSIPLPGAYRSSLAAEARAEAMAAAARLEATRRALEETAAQDVAQMQATLEAWQPLRQAAADAESHQRRAQRAYELGESSLAELLLSVTSSADTLHEELLARLAAHEALARLRIDAHELWAVHEDEGRDAH